MTFSPGHYHLHNETGQCYGDLRDFEDAARCAAEHAYPWCVPDNEPVDGMLTVIDAPICIDQCNDNGTGERD